MVNQIQTAETVQTAQNGNGGNRRQYPGTQSTMSASKFTGNQVLRSIGAHMLPDGTIAIVAGNAQTEVTRRDGSKVVDIINVGGTDRSGYQDGIEGMLAQALVNNVAERRANFNLGMWGVLPGRVIQLEPEQAKAWGVDATFVEGVRADKSRERLDGVIFVSDTAILALASEGVPVKATREVPKLEATEGAKTYDLFDFATGLALAKAGDPRGVDVVPSQHGMALEIRIFPKGEQKAAELSARQAQNDGFSAAAGGEPVAATTPVIAANTAAYANRSL